MKKAKKILWCMVGVMVLSFFLGMGAKIDAKAQVRIVSSHSVSCAVPLPASKPGEERKDMISAVIGMGVLLVIVSGGLVVLKKSFGEKKE